MKKSILQSVMNERVSLPFISLAVLNNSKSNANSKHIKVILDNYLDNQILLFLYTVAAVAKILSDWFSHEIIDHLAAALLTKEPSE